MSIKEKIKSLYKFWKGIWAREVAAGLAFYFIVGFVPALCVLLYVIRDNFPMQLPRDIGFSEDLASLYESFVNNASEATRGGGIFFVFTSLYSAMNLFYRFSKCGEILYQFERQHNSIIRRALSFVFMVVITAVFSVAVTLFLVIDKYSDGAVFKVIASVCAIFVACVSVIILNFLICPFKLQFREVVYGSLLTISFWVIITVGFTVYLNNFGNFDRLYGALSGMFALMLYVYLMMQAFTFGVAYNIRRMGKIKTKIRHNPTR